MSGGACALGRRTTESETWRGSGLAQFVALFGLLGFFWRGTYGRGPSSTTQSLRSISDVLRPRIGGDGDGDLESDLLDDDGGEGAMGKYVPDVGERGVSRRLGADLNAPACAGFIDASASNAWTLDFTPADTSSDSIWRACATAARGRKAATRVVEVVCE